MSAFQPATFSIIEPSSLQTVIDKLKALGYATVGPTVKEGVIVGGPINSVEDLPRGWTDFQDAACYRLVERQDRALFGYVLGPQSWKKYVYPPRLNLWRVAQREGRQEIDAASSNHERVAFIGVRSCEIQALRILDAVLAQGDYIDADYRARRRDNFIVAVNCVEPGGTCFCSSLGTGPSARDGFDLALTEVCQPGEHFMLVQSGSERGTELLKGVAVTPAADEQVTRAQTLLEQAAGRMGRRLDPTDLKPLLYRNAENRYWEQVGKRCLACANCTLVCPTCFCMTVEDVTDLTGTQAARTRRWDSCFNEAYSYIHGGCVRTSPSARYRHWISHKLGTWQDQFGMIGCVGCGRCITWCPVGIDITEEIGAIRAGEQASKETVSAKE